MADNIRSILKAQNRAALAMLKKAIEECPEDLWLRQDQANAFWQLAYHTVFFAHLYLQPDSASFRPWKHHQGNVQHEDGIAGRPDPQSKLPLIPDPYPREKVLEYLQFCDDHLDSWIDSFDPLQSESGFHWYKVTKLEHQLISLRHIQHGAAQLAARLRSELGIGIGWVSSR
jgi:hypothetical protein